jgi:hypothetical protein
MGVRVWYRRKAEILLKWRGEAKEQPQKNSKAAACVFSEPYFGGIKRAYSFSRQQPTYRAGIFAPQASVRTMRCGALRANASK